MKCPHCANDIPEGSHFCNHCGMPPEAKPKHSGKPVLMFVLGMVVAGLAATGVYFWHQAAVKTPAPATVQAAPAATPVAAPAEPPAPVFEAFSSYPEWRRPESPKN
jgi:Double zinc ribbon